MHAQRLGVSEHVDFPGFVSNPYAFMSKASLFVLSSRHEGLPTVLIEAMACGCPVVSTNCPFGPDEILEDGRWGELVPVGDAKALAEAMLRALKSPRSSEALRERASVFGIDRRPSPATRSFSLGGLSGMGNLSEFVWVRWRGVLRRGGSSLQRCAQAHLGRSVSGTSVRIVLINLERATARREQMATEFARIGIDYEVWPARDARALEYRRGSRARGSGGPPSGWDSIPFRTDRLPTR